MVRKFDFEKEFDLFARECVVIFHETREKNETNIPDFNFSASFGLHFLQRLFKILDCI